MKKEEVRTKEVVYIEIITLCDDCNISTRHYKNITLPVCCVCKADLCESCTTRVYNTATKKIETYCFNCRNLIHDNNQEIEKLRDKANELEKELFFHCRKDRYKKQNPDIPENIKLK